MIANNIPSDIAEKVSNDIRPFAGYGFNLSHAACYAFIAYQTAYLKANYPIEYMTAVLQVFYTEEDKVIKYAKVARDMGMEVLPPDINRSEEGFRIDGERAIRFGLGAIKGLGVATVEAILEERKVRDIPLFRDEEGNLVELTEENEPSTIIDYKQVGGSFTSVEDVLERIPKKNMNKKALTALCYSGTFDTLLDGITNNRFEHMAYLLNLRGEAPDKELIEAITKYSDRLKFEKEREVLGLYVTGHVLSRIAEPTDWEGLDDATHFTMVSLVEARVIRTKKGDNMAFLKVDTLEGERSLTLFPTHYEQVKEGLVAGMLLKVGIKGKMNWQRNQKDFIINSITIPKRINKEIWNKIEANKHQYTA
ncbi:hypothetical protein ACFX4N_24045 [Priestia sp. YIM B13551]|uniref:helix-hairpin-helix domain-containing protein n=1 Tax=Priestia sp. YIM B13551 TaxID=3366306 RepID=UPI003670D046